MVAVAVVCCWRLLPLLPLGVFVLGVFGAGFGRREGGILDFFGHEFWWSERERKQGCP